MPPVLGLLNIMKSDGLKRRDKGNNWFSIHLDPFFWRVLLPKNQLQSVIKCHQNKTTQQLSDKLCLKQARKPRNYTRLKLQLINLLTGVRCSVDWASNRAKNKAGKWWTSNTFQGRQSLFLDFMLYSKNKLWTSWVNISDIIKHWLNWITNISGFWILLQ